MKTLIGDSGTYPYPEKDPGIKEGWDYWIESGKYYTAPAVDAAKFGGHAYDNGGYEHGIRDCPCGCWMGSSSSGGPVNPFGPCPGNPLHGIE